MRIAVLGYGKQGQAAVDYWGPGNEITVCDINPEVQVPDGVETQTGPDYLRDLERFKLIVRSPLIHPREIVAANNEHILKKVTTVSEEFMRNCPAPIIGVTGTKGKGTTSSLITKILEAAGHKVHLGGNIGVAPLEMLKWGIQPEDWVVLELANFQLIDLRVSPKIAVCLLVVPEHLDWHKDMAEYVQAKQNMFRHQSDKDLAIFNRLSDYSSQVAGVSPAMKLSYEVPALGQQPTEMNGAYVLGDSILMDDEKVCQVSDVQLLGRHNLENVCAAIAATWEIIDQNKDAIIKAVREFSGLAHRLEFVRELDGVKFYNDSFASAPDAAAAAMRAIPSSKVMIVGGYDRGLDMAPIVEAVTDPAAQVSSVVAIGQTGPRIVAGLKSAGFSNYLLSDAQDLKTIIGQARSQTKPGQSIIFSPGCASFDLFKNFEDRGLQYKAQVDAL